MVFGFRGFGGLRLRRLVSSQQRRLGVNAVMRNLPLILLDPAFQAHRLFSYTDIQCCAGINGVGKTAHHLRITAETDGLEDSFVIAFLFVDNGVRIGG